jgi:hypothetical protein
MSENGADDTRFLGAIEERVKPRRSATKRIKLKTRKKQVHVAGGKDFFGNLEIPSLYVFLKGYYFCPTLFFNS